MSISFRAVSHPPLRDLTVSAPDGAIIGVVGEKGAGKAALLRLAAGVETPRQGEVEGGTNRRLIRLGEPLNFSPADVLALDAPLACQDAVVKARAAIALERMRRAGSTILMASYDEPLLLGLCDEIWWLTEGRLAAHGDPREVIDRHRRFVADGIAAWGATISPPLDTRDRRGDGRAEIVALEALNAENRPTSVWKSGESVAARIVVRFHAAVESPVIGIMIRTRVGFEVYGTNTELEKLGLGPYAAGETIAVLFRFHCELCPNHYTLTAASHDADGDAHDWLDDAVAVTVVDSRPTAGVANLRATVDVEPA
jgi:homopolymeric O-antigen transport system ATP-binding protein